MERKNIIKSLKSIGYSDDGINSIMCGRRRPKLESQYEMLDRFGIPLETWRDIKSYLKSMPEQPVHVQEETKNRLHQKEIA